METRKDITIWIIVLLFGVLGMKYTLVILHGMGKLSLDPYISILDKDSGVLLTLLVSIVSYWFGAKGKEEAVETAVRTTIKEMKS